MSLADRALPLLRRLDPETAHGLAIRGLRLGLGPRGGAVTGKRLAVDLAGLALPNPVGLAAGFDKQAEVPGALFDAGFGFVELGGTTPRPQEGNPRPRLFRLAEEGAVINRFGLNSVGAAEVARRLARGRPAGVIGLNLGANKDSADRAADYAEVLRVVGPHLDFATVNVSSPNTERLRDLQGREALAGLLAGVMEARTGLPRPIPIFLKIAPDLTDAELADIAEVATASGIAAIVATNTTIARDGLSGRHAAEAGGLSGRPLFERSTRVLVRLHRLTEGRMPLVGVGGVASAEDAYAKIRAGASAVQLYTALVFAGLGLVPRIVQGLDALLARDGFASVAEAVGTDRERWLSSDA